MALTIGLHLAAGVAMAAFWYLYALILPFRLLPKGIHHLAIHRAWPAINLVGTVGSILAVLGWAQLRVEYDSDLGSWAEAAVLIAVVGLVLLAGNLSWEAILWPPIARRDPDLLAFAGPIYRDRLLLTYFSLAGLLFAVGYVMVSFTFPSEVTPMGSRIGLGIGAPLFAFGPLFGRLQILCRSLGITLVSLGHVWLALSITTT